MNENDVTLDLKMLTDWEDMILWDCRNIRTAISDKFPNLPSFTIDEFILSLAETDLKLCACKAYINRECRFVSHGREFRRDNLKSYTFAEIDTTKGERAGKALKRIFDSIWSKSADN